MTYQLSEIPAAASGSRFYLAQTAAGWSADPAEQLGSAFAEFVSVRRAAMSPLTPTPITVNLKLAEKVSGEWILRDRGSVSAVPTRVSERPGKRVGVKPSGAVLDTLALGESPGWTDAPDDLVWASLLEVCRVHDLSGRGWRTLVDSVARLVCLRAGVEVTEEMLPHVAVMERTVVQA